jgi:hypothetical protein
VDPVSVPSAPAPEPADDPSEAGGSAGSDSRGGEQPWGGTGPHPLVIEITDGGVVDAAVGGQEPAPAPPAGRHEASGERPPFRPAPASAGDSGRRRRGRADADADASEVDAAELGLADLLAEALDAFRKL